MMGVSEEEMYNIPTAEYAYRRGGFINRQLTIYHVALHACADLKNVEVLVDIPAYLLILLVKKNQILPAPMHVCDCYKFWYWQQNLLSDKPKSASSNDIQKHA